MMFNRREFLARSLVGMAALAAPVYSGKKERFPGTTVKNGLLHRKLGKTGVILPVVSMGVMNTRDSALIRKAYEVGIRHFDTAASYGYGRNETMIGDVIRDMGVRDRVVLATKVLVPNLRRGLQPREIQTKCIQAVETSLGNLKTDRIDILYLHDISSVDDVFIEGIPEALTILKKQGKARFVGFSTHQNMAACLNEAARQPLYDVVLTSFNYSLADDSELFRSLKTAAEQGIGLIAMKTQCGQYWYKQQLPDAQQKFFEGRIVNSAVLKWVLRHPFITTAVPGVTTFQHIDEDISAAKNLEFTSEEADFLREKNVQTGMGMCRQCRSCVARCPKGVEIPTLMRAHMYATCYANPEQALQTLQSLPNPKGLYTCMQCSDCQVVCPFSIDAPARIRDLVNASV